MRRNDSSTCPANPILIEAAPDTKACPRGRSVLAIESDTAMGEDPKLRVGEKVVLVAIPPGFLDDLPDEDQRAIRAIVGKPVMFFGYDDDGRVELDFAEDARPGHHHTIWVAPEFIEAYRG